MKILFRSRLFYIQFLLLISFFSSSTKLFSQFNLPISESYVIGGTGADYAWDFIHLSDGGMVIVGETTSTNGDFSFNTGGNNAFIKKLDANGNTVWTQIRGFANRSSEFRSVAEDNDGSLYVAGYTNKEGSNDYYVMKFSANGNEQWSRIYGSGQDDKAVSVHATTTGVAVIGSTLGGFFDATRYFVPSSSYNSQKLWFLELSKLNGVILKNRLAHGTSPSNYSYNITHCTIVEGEFICTGYTNNKTMTSGCSNNSPWNVILVKLNQNGVKLWDRTYGGTNEQYGTHIISTSDGGFFISGFSRLTSNNCDVIGNFGGGTYDMFYIKTNASGNRQWSRIVGGNRDDIAHSSVELPQGGFLLVGLSKSTDNGFSNNNTNEDVAFVSIDENGVSHMTKNNFGGSNSEGPSNTLPNFRGNTRIKFNNSGGLVFVNTTKSQDGDVPNVLNTIEKVWIAKFDYGAGNCSCVNAIQIPASSIGASFKVDCLGNNNQSGSQVNPMTGNTSDAAWYYFYAPNDGYISIESCNENVDTRLHLHRFNGSCNNLIYLNTSVDQFDDNCNTGNGNTFAAQVNQYPVQRNNIYMIEWDNGWSSTPFDFNFFYSSSSNINGFDESYGSGCDRDCTPNHYSSKYDKIVIPIVFHLNVSDYENTYNRDGLNDIRNLLNNVNTLYTTENIPIELDFAIYDPTFSSNKLCEDFSTLCDCNDIDSEYIDPYSGISPTTRYINIYSFKEYKQYYPKLSGGCHSEEVDILGFASYPQQRSPVSNKIVWIKENVIANNYFEVLAHELGHSLGLYHTFEQSVYPASGACFADGIADTYYDEDGSEYTIGGNLMDYCFQTNADPNQFCTALTGCQRAKMLDVLYEVHNDLCPSIGQPEDIYPANGGSMTVQLGSSITLNSKTSTNYYSNTGNVVHWGLYTGSNWINFGFHNSITIITGTSGHITSPGTYQIQIYDACPYNLSCKSAVINEFIEVLGPNTNCPSEYSNNNGNRLIGTQSTSKKYESDGVIESTQIINNNVSVEYDSKTTILLLPGFEVDRGSEFHAYIDGCGNLLDESDEIENHRISIDSDKKNVANIEVYPNPTNNNVTVQYNIENRQDISVYLMDFSGRVVQEINSSQQDKGQHSQVITFGPRLSHGLYNVVLWMEEGVYSKKIIYQKK